MDKVQLYFQLADCSVLITTATLLCYHADHLYCNVVKLLHDVKVLVLCESRIICTEYKK